jgi:hypothetical protein
MNILEHKSCKDKIQGYTRPPKISPEPERSSTLPNSQLELIYYIGEYSPNSSGLVPWSEWEIIILEEIAGWYIGGVVAKQVSRHRSVSHLSVAIGSNRPKWAVEMILRRWLTSRPGHGRPTWLGGGRSSFMAGGPLLSWVTFSCLLDPS